MYRYLQLLVIGLLLATTASAADQVPLPLDMVIPYGQLSLRQAQQQAIEASPGVAAAVARVQQAQALVDQARSDHAAAGGRQPQSPVAGPVDSARLGRRRYRYNDAVKDFSAGVQVNWLLFDGFARRAVHSCRAGPDQGRSRGRRMRPDACSPRAVAGGLLSGATGGRGDADRPAEPDFQP